MFEINCSFSIFETQSTFRKCRKLNGTENLKQGRNGMENRNRVLDILGWIFGLVVLAIGIINTFWGNDPGFGVFLVLLSFVYYPPLNAILKEKTRLSVPKFVKIALGLFILWASLGVGELFDKIDMMLMDLS